jgi:5-formyltetrahydrofolate cyclo-ligase
VANSPDLDKPALRARARERRRAANLLTGQAIRDVALALPELGAASCVAAYIARMGEPDTTPLLAALRSRGVEVLLPVLRPDLDLDWAADDGGRQPSTVRAGLAEPVGPPLGLDALARAQVVIVPALAVDQSGGRLGYGGGSYDRALVRRSPTAYVVALLHEGELSSEPLPVEAHDVRVDAVVLPSGVVRFGPRASG